MKNLPIGIEDFKETLNYYYVDKTLIIKDITDNLIGKSVLVTRPRRFGKSLMISMLNYYYSNAFNSSSLFLDKKIFKEGKKYTDELNKYPVICLSFKDLTESSDCNVFKSLINKISGLYGKYTFLLDSDKIHEAEKETFRNILYGKSDNIIDYTYSVYNLSELLYKHYNSKVIILLDEYDAPIENSYNSGKYDETINFFRKFYSSFLKGNEYLYFSFITGVLEIAKESIFSDLNNLNVFSVLDMDFTEYFGFTESEVKEIFEKYNTPFNKDKIRNWYGGYGNTKTEIYNPWSVFNFVNKEIYSEYWVNTASNKTISDLIYKNPKSSFFLNEIINNDNKIIKINNALSYKDLSNNEESIISFLVQCGYLVARIIDDTSNYNIKIPNFEIKETFKNEIIGRNINQSVRNIAEDLKLAISQGDEHKISDIFSKYILNSFSYYELNNEKEYKIMLIGIFSVLFSEYVVKSEVNNKYGRCDIMILPKADKEKGYIIEIKKHKGIMSNAKLEQSALTAISQIKDKEYYNELIHYGLKNIILYGFSFDDKKIKVLFEKL